MLTIMSAAATSSSSSSLERDHPVQEEANPSSTIPDIQKLFDYNRFEGQWNWPIFLLYAPFGLVILLVRILIGLLTILVATILPKTFSFRCSILRSMCTILGFIVKESNPDEKHKNGIKVIVANRVTNFDHLAVGLLVPNVVPCVWDLPKILSWGLGFSDFGAVTHGRDTLIQNAKAHLQTRDALPILTHPESATTNGRAGLLKFSTWPFSLDMPIQPVLINVSRPAPFNATPSVLGSRWWSDLFWFLYLPFTVFTIKYMQPTKRRENETPDDFAKRVQREMASALGITPTNYTAMDKIELAKRLFQVQYPRRPTQAPSSNVPSSWRSSSRAPRVSAQIELMSRRVKEVLPQVPLSVIQKDLSITTNVDETITRILEGQVPYTPETEIKPSTSKSSISTSPSSLQGTSCLKLDKDGLPSLQVAAKSFGRTAAERISSYHERKAALIEAARIRYIKKHNLKVD